MRRRVDELISALVGVCVASGQSVQATARPDLWLNGIRLDPARSLAASGIRDGSRLGLGGALPVVGRSGHGGTAEIRVVAGPDAGLIVPVTPGEYHVARDGGDVRRGRVGLRRVRNRPDVHGQWSMRLLRERDAVRVELHESFNR